MQTSHTAGKRTVGPSNDTAIQAQALACIQRAIEENRLVLPSPPDTLLEVRSAVNDQHCSHRQLAQIISKDLAISTRLLKVVNSSSLRAHRAINDVHGAVTRLGGKLVHTLVTSLTMTQMMSNSIVNAKGIFAEFLRNHHDRTVQVASRCYGLAANVPALDQDEALLAGLIHDIGVLPLVQYAGQEASLRHDPEAALNLVDALHTQVGKHVLAKWSFSQQLIAVAAEHEDVLRIGVSDQPDYVDLVIVANLHLDSTSGETSCSVPPELSNIPAFRKLDQEPSALWRDMGERLEQATGILSA